MAQEFELPDEIQKALSNHVKKVKTCTDLLSEIQTFSQTVKCPHLHTTTKQAVELFYQENYLDYHKPISLRTLKAFNSMTQEEIRRNESKLSEKDLRNVAWYKNLFFTKLKQQLLDSPPL
jgi:hypothetical protein